MQKFLLKREPFEADGPKVYDAATRYMPSYSVSGESPVLYVQSDEPELELLVRKAGERNSNRTDCAMPELERERVSQWCLDAFNEAFRAKLGVGAFIDHVTDACHQRYRLLFSRDQCESCVVGMLLHCMGRGMIPEPVAPYAISALIWHFYGKPFTDEEEQEPKSLIIAPGSQSTH